MGKDAAARRQDDSEAIAVLRNVRISPQKLNVVAQMIRGMDVEKALATLAFSRKRISGDVRKVLQSAIANAENNHQLDVDRLFVKEAAVGRSMVMRRFRPRARGRVGRLRKPFAHLTVVVREREEEVMGQKVNPIGLRLGINRTWDLRWFASRDYADLLHEDLRIRKFLFDKLKQAGISRIVIERPAKRARITIYTARPGVVIGKKGQDIEKLRQDLSKRTGVDVHLNIVEIRKPETDAKLVAENIAQQLERRVAFRRTMKRAVQSAMRLGAEGIRINCGGRLGGAEIARIEWYREGRVPLHTLRADIDYGEATAQTTYGCCGVKVWVFKGEVLAHDPMAQDKRLSEQQPSQSR